jgi:hypothetical protein
LTVSPPLCRWPPSAARLDPAHPSLIDTVLPALLKDGAPLLVNLYPYLAWRAAEGHLGIILFIVIIIIIIYYWDAFSLAS